jgi:hypothetical protein
MSKMTSNHREADRRLDSLEAPPVVKTASASGGVITAEQAMHPAGVTITNIGATAANTASLPPAREGMTVQAVVEAADTNRQPRPVPPYRRLW